MKPEGIQRGFAAKTWVFVLCLCAWQCFGEPYAPDAAILGMPRRKLEQTARCLYLTSKGREVDVLANNHRIVGLCLQRLNDAAGALKDERGKAATQPRDASDSPESELKQVIESEENARLWLEQNCVPGTSLYFYRIVSDKGVREGYCVIKEGVVLNSFILAERSIAEQILRSDDWSTTGWFLSRLAGHQLTTAKGRTILIKMTIFDDPTLPGNGYANVTSDGVLHKGVQGPLAGEDFGESKLSEQKMQQLRDLLLKLPPTEPLKARNRFLVSFLSHGRWTTRSYSGGTRNDPLKAILLCLGLDSEVGDL